MRFLIQKRAAITIQKHVRGIQGRAAHEDWLAGKDGPAGLAKKRERLMAAIKEAATLLEDNGMGPKRPAEALEGYMAVYKQASLAEVSRGVPQLSQHAVTMQMRNKMFPVRTIQTIFEEFVSTAVLPSKGVITTPDLLHPVLTKMFAIFVHELCFRFGE